jgi:hypothetical protein
MVYSGFPEHNRGGLKVPQCPTPLVKNMKTLLAFSPAYTDATSFYRSFGPLGELKRQYPELNILKGEEVNWATLAMVDGLFLQRPFSATHAQVIDMAQSNGKKIWIDYDDDLYSVPLGNRAYKIYHNQQTQNNITTLVAKADFVSVSTHQLKRRLCEILNKIKEKNVPGAKTNHDKVRVIPNAYNPNFCKYRGQVNQQRKIITWRGSDTHDKDLLVYTSALKQAFSTDLSWTMNLIGQPFWYTIEQIASIPEIKESNLIVTPALDPAEYWKMLYQTNPSLVFVPLWDCPFNRAKSNIAWIEGAHAGAGCLGPDWEEWRKPGILNYKDPKDFYEKMLAVLKGEINTMKLYEDGWQYIQENLLLEKINPLRKQILDEMWS